MLIRLVGIEGVILPKNQFPFSGKEKMKWVNNSIAYYYCDYARSHRLVKHKNGEAICGLQLIEESEVLTINNIYTVEDERRKGHAKNLLFFAKEYLGKRILHSSNLTKDGRVFARKVNI